MANRTSMLAPLCLLISAGCLDLPAPNDEAPAPDSTPDGVAGSVDGSRGGGDATADDAADRDGTGDDAGGVLPGDASVPDGAPDAAPDTAPDTGDPDATLADAAILPDVALADGGPACSPEDRARVGEPTACGVGACASRGVLRCEEGALIDTCAPGQPDADDATCDGIDDDCDGLIDEDFAPSEVACGVGACTEAGATLCQDGEVADTCRVGEPAPNDPTCDGVDDDCDGTADEDYPAEPTQCGVGACSAEGERGCINGMIQDSCQPGPAAPDDRTCDAVDDDCDGAIDEDYQGQPSLCDLGLCQLEGQSVCEAGREIELCPMPLDHELCGNGIDDDCDGEIDEGFSIGQACSVGQGACRRRGEQICSPDRLFTLCSVVPGLPEAERCDGLDNDCDGAIDEDFPLGAGCEVGLGLCARQGELICGPGGDAVCDARPGPRQVEVCNGEDDDCDGAIDEDFDLRTDRLNCGRCGNSCGGWPCVIGRCIDPDRFFCARTGNVIEVGPMSVTLRIDTQTEANRYQGSCGGRGFEHVLGLLLDDPADIIFRTINIEYDTLLYIRRLCDLPGSEIACNDDIRRNNQASIIATRLDPGRYYLFVDGWEDDPGGATGVEIDIRPR